MCFCSSCSVSIGFHLEVYHTYLYEERRAFIKNQSLKTPPQKK
jgi:hypothetical protein